MKLRIHVSWMMRRERPSEWIQCIRIACLLLWLAAAAFAEGPAAGPAFSFAVIGDGGCGCPAQQLVSDRMEIWNKTRPFSTVLMLGDNVYGEYGLFGLLRTGRKGGDPALFAGQFDAIYKAHLSRGVKFYAALGNHDLEADNGKAMIADRERFHVLDPRGYYAFSPEGLQDLIEIFALNSNTLVAGRKDVQQLQWLATALSESHAQWKIVFAHHPIYSGPGGHGADSDFRTELEPILIHGRADVFLAGHNHYYARLKPKRGIQYFISGGGGRDLRSPGAGNDIERAAGANHFLYFEVRPDRLDFWAVSSAGSLLDGGTIPADRQARAALGLE